MGTYQLHRGEDITIDSLVSIPKADEGEGYQYGFRVVGDPEFWNGGAAKKRYLVYIDIDIDDSTPFTGDSNGAAFRITGSNYSAHDTNYILRPINIAVTNRSGGTMGQLENFIGIQNKSGGTVPTMRGLTVITENYGTNATESGGLDVISRNESNSATLAYGIRIRNDDRSSQSALQSAINVDSHASSGGFDTLIDASAAELTEYDSGTQVVLMKFQGADADTFYLIHDTDAATVLSVATSVS